MVNASHHPPTEISKADRVAAHARTLCHLQWSLQLLSPGIWRMCEISNERPTDDKDDQRDRSAFAAGQFRY
jgi:hypothetical protein